MAGNGLSPCRAYTHTKNMLTHAKRSWRPASAHCCASGCKTEQPGLPGSQAVVWGSPGPHCSPPLQPPFPTSVPQIQERAVAVSQGQKSGFCRNRMDLVPRCHLITRFSPFSLSLSFDDKHLTPGHLRSPGMSRNFWNAYNLY